MARTWAELTFSEIQTVQEISNAFSAQGQLLTYDGSNIQALSPGTSGHVLTSQGAGADLVWSAASGIGGSTGATDNAILRADGTGGSTMQSSGITIDDSDNIQGAATGLTVSTATNGNITLNPGGSGTTTVNAGSGGVTISTDAGNSDISLSPHGTGTVDIAASKSLSFNGTDILADSAGTMTLSNVDALDATTSTTIGANTMTLTNKTFDANGTGNSLSNVETADIASGSKSGLDATLVTGTAGTNGNLVQWDANGDAIDSSLATANVYSSGGTDVALADGGTGASLADPNADRMLFWDDSAGAVTWLSPATNISITDTNLNVADFSKAITIESPTSSEDITLFFTDDAITINQLNAVLNGSSTPSVTWTIRFNSDRSAAGTEVVTSGTTTTSTTTGSEVTSFNDATIPAGNWVWLETTAQSGTVDALNVTITYTVD